MKCDHVRKCNNIFPSTRNIPIKLLLLLSWTDFAPVLVVSLCLVVFPGIVCSVVFVLLLLDATLIIDCVTSSGSLVILVVKPFVADFGVGFGSCFAGVVIIVLLLLVVVFDVDGGSGCGASDSLACMQ